MDCSKPRPATQETIPELPVFTSGIRGSRPSSIPVQSFEQSDEPSQAVPVQTIQQPAVVYAQSAPSSPQPPEFRPVNEVHEKDEDVVSVIANLGAVSNYQSNLLTPTVASATPITPTLGAYLAQQHERQRQEERQERLERQRHEERFERQRQEEQRQRQEQQRLQEERTRPEHQVIQPVQYRPAVPLAISRTSSLNLSPENQAVRLL